MCNLRILLLYLLCYFIYDGVHGQGCPSTDIQFGSQGSIDSFPVKYPDCHEIEGDVFIITSDGIIRNLDSLYNVYGIGGSLVIKHNALLTSIQGLSHLEWIEDDLSIINNDSLLDVTGLEKVANIDTLIIERNLLLQDVRGLNGLKVAHHIELEDFPRIIGLDSLHQVTGNFRIYNSMMQYYEVAPQLDTVTGTLSISSSPFLRDVSGLAKLQFAGSFFLTNTGIEDFDGMTALAVIERDLSIRGNDSLRSVSGLISLIRIGGTVDISDNDKLRDLTNFGFISEVAGDLIIERNDSLRQLTGLEQLHTVQGDCRINGNENLDNVDGLLSLQKIGGSLFLNRNESLQDISGLNQLDSIGGDFELQHSRIDTLDGINNLDFISGRLYMHYNDKLISISGFGNLQYVGGIRLEEHRFIQTISGFGNLKQINGDCEFISNWRLAHLPSWPGITTIEGNLLVLSGPDLIDLSGLDSLRHIGGKLELVGTQLDSLHGLEQLESCEGGLTLRSLVLTSLDPLSNLKSIHGPLTITEMYYLTDLHGLRNLDPSGIYSPSDSFDIIIRDNPFLKNCSIDIMCEILEVKEKQVHIQNNFPGCQSPLDILTKCQFPYACLPDGITLSRQSQIDSFRIAYPQCTFIQGDVIIEESAHGEIISLDSLSNVQTVGGNLRISTNFNLTNLDGLSNLTTIGGGIRINANDNLSSLNGLANVDPMQLTMTRPQVYDLWLYTNPSLHSCAVASVCGILENPGAAVIVQANGTDCSDPESIRMECLVGVSTLRSYQSLALYPNPTSGELHIGTLTDEEKTFEYMDIYNSVGALVMHGFFKNKLSLAYLNPGVYTIVCFTKDMEVATGRFIIPTR